MARDTRSDRGRDDRRPSSKTAPPSRKAASPPQKASGVKPAETPSDRKELPAQALANVATTAVAARGAKPTFSLEPKDAKELMELAAMVSGSTLIPDAFRGKPGDIFIAASTGMELGLTFMQSLQGIIPINGRPTIWGDHLIGLVRASGLCGYVKEWIDKPDGEDHPETWVAWCETHRIGEPEPVRRSFSFTDAENAGLLRKNLYDSYLARMLAMRARSFCLRDVYADILRGIRAYEEFLDVDGRLVDDVKAEQAEREIPMPRAKVEAAAVAEPVEVCEHCGAKDGRHVRETCPTTKSKANGAGTLQDLANEAAARVGAKPIKIGEQVVNRKIDMDFDEATNTVTLRDVTPDSRGTGEVAEGFVPEEPTPYDGLTVLSVKQKAYEDSPDGKVYSISFRTHDGGEMTMRTTDRKLAGVADDARKSNTRVDVGFRLHSLLGFEINRLTVSE